MGIEIKNILDTMETRDQNDSDIEYNSVCFLDILGFKKMIQSKQNDVNIRKAERCRIKTFIKSIAGVLQRFRDNNKTFKHISLILSDSIYIFYNKEDEQSVLLLITIIYLYGIKNKVFFRGGISDKGVDYSPSGDQSIFLGHGIIESYELETYISNYSRVVFAKSYESEFGFSDFDGYKCFDIVKFIKDKTQEVVVNYNYLTNFVKDNGSQFCELIGHTEEEVCDECKKMNNEKLPLSYSRILEMLIDSVKEEKDKFEKHTKDRYQKLFSKYYLQHKYLKLKEGEHIG